MKSRTTSQNIATHLLLHTRKPIEHDCTVTSRNIVNTRLSDNGRDTQGNWKENGVSMITASTRRFEVHLINAIELEGMPFVCKGTQRQVTNSSARERELEVRGAA